MSSARASLGSRPTSSSGGRRSGRLPPVDASASSTGSRRSGTRCEARSRWQRSRPRSPAVDGPVRRRARPRHRDRRAALPLVLRRFPESHVVGADLAEEMLARARANVPDAEFRRADASALPFAEESFDLVTHANMIPFFDELERVLAPGGNVALRVLDRRSTPIYVPPERLRAELRSGGVSRTLRSSPPAAGRHSQRASVSVAAKRRSRHGDSGPDVSFIAAREHLRFFLCDHIVDAGSAASVATSPSGPGCEGRNRTGDTTVFRPRRLTPPPP